MANNAVVIVAAGRGSRIGDDGGPKQYRALGGQSVLQKTVSSFTNHENIHLVQVVIHADDEELYAHSVSGNQKLLPPVVGGATRQESCAAGVKALRAHNVEKVLIHDAARPFTSLQTISNVLSGIAEGICALPAIAVADTLKRANENAFVLDTVPRESLHLAQTPQGFNYAEILAAHKKAELENLNDFTDDAAVAEWAGMKVMLVEGDRDNFKITTMQDLKTAEMTMGLKDRIPDVRTGSGYDVHTLGPGDKIILCGVEIDHNQSLQGHSDADVGLHSLTDALLGTIGAGDIGSHFPPSDPRWKGAASDQFLRHAAELVRAEGGSIANLDVTIVCEAPKIGPHRDAMREKIAEICDLDLPRVSVKATTNERIGFIGREEGIAAIATASVSFGMI